MDNFFKQDIFFTITTAAVMFVTFLVGALLIYLIMIARSVNSVMKKVQQEADIISEELGDLRRNIRKEGVKIKHLTKFFNNVKSARGGSTSGGKGK